MSQLVDSITNTVTLYSMNHCLPCLSPPDDLDALMQLSEQHPFLCDIYHSLLLLSPLSSLRPDLLPSRVSLLPAGIQPLLKRSAQLLL